MEENFDQSVLSKPKLHSALTSLEAVQIIELFGTDQVYYIFGCTIKYW